MALSYARRPGARPRQKERRGGLLRLIATIAVLAWLIRSYVVAPFSIPSGSMLPALFVGDYLFVAKWPYGYSRVSFPFGFPSFEGRVLERLPERGEIVVFRHPQADYDLIKRVIGLPGDTIEVRGGQLVLNGRPLAREPQGTFAMPVSANSPCRVVAGATPMRGRTDGGSPACLYPLYRETLPGGRSYSVIDQVESPRADNLQPTVVPDGHFFLMGDNRDDSLDSRFRPTEGGIGFVPAENVIGRAIVIFWSTDGSASYVKPWTWFGALRSDRIGDGFGGPAR